jgi:hypothetical protein
MEPIVFEYLRRYPDSTSSPKGDCSTSLPKGSDFVIYLTSFPVKVTTALANVSGSSRWPK